MSFKDRFVQSLRKDEQEYRKELEQKPSFDILFSDEKWGPVLTELAGMPEYQGARDFFEHRLSGSVVTPEDRANAQPLIEKMWEIMEQARELSAALRDKPFLVEAFRNADGDLADAIRAHVDVTKLATLFADEANLAFLIIRNPDLTERMKNLVSIYHETMGSVEGNDKKLADFCEKHGLPLREIEACFDIEDPMERRKKLGEIVAAVFEEDGWFIGGYKKLTLKKSYVKDVEKLFIDISALYDELHIYAGVIGDNLFGAMEGDDAFRKTLDAGIFGRKNSFEIGNVMSIDEAADLCSDENLDKVLEKEAVNKYWREWITKEAKIGSRKGVAEGEIKKKIRAWWTGLSATQQSTLRRQAMADFTVEKFGKKTEGVAAESVFFIVNTRLEDMFGAYYASLNY